MALVDLKIEPAKSPFTYDVWCCPECRYVVTVEQYKQSALDFRCIGCDQTTLSDYRLWPGTVNDN